MENWLSIAAGIYLLTMVLYGHHRGFIRLAVSMAALFVTFIIVNVSMPMVTEYLKENTSIRQNLISTMKETVGIEEGGFAPSSSEALGDQLQIIENLELPQSWKDALIKNNNSQMYHTLGVEAFADYVGSYLADTVIKSISFVVMFSVVYLAIRLVVRWLDLIAKLPILSGINKIAGALLGGMEGLIFLWILCIVLTAFSGTSWGMNLICQIKESEWLSFLYDHNILNTIIIGVLHGLV